MAQRVNLLDRPGLKQVISQLMDHFGIRYILHILDEVTLLQHFPKVNSVRNVNGVPNNPGNSDNPDGVPFRKIHFIQEPQILEKKQTSIEQEVIVEEQVEIKYRTKTKTKQRRTITRKSIEKTKTTY